MSNPLLNRPLVAAANVLTCVYWVCFLMTTHQQQQQSGTLEGGISRFTLVETERKNDRDKCLCTTVAEQRQSVMVELCYDFNFSERKLILLSHLIAQ